MTVRTDSSEEKLQSLIRQAQGGGDEAHIAFQALYEQFARNVLAYVTNRRRGRLEPDDLASETWLKVHRSLHQFQSGNFRAWLFSVARSVVFDDGRRQSVRPEELPLEGDVARGEDPSLEDPRVDTLKACLEELDGEFIATLRLKVQTVPTSEIAERTGVTEATVYTRISRGKELLEECVRRKES